MTPWEAARGGAGQGATPDGTTGDVGVPAGAGTDRHYHKASEEFYFMLEGEAQMEIDGETCSVGPGDGILIPPGAWHQIIAKSRARFLCCCAPPYDHADTYFA